MRRREFLGVLGGAAAVWPLAARAQQGERVRRIGALLSWSAESLTIVGAFSQGLQELGWKLGSNVRIDYRWGAVDDDRVRQYAAELVSLAPDIILASGSTAVRALQRATSTVPIVFVSTSDPVGGGLVASMAQPGGNATGFLTVEYGLSTKWLELLKQIAPRVTRAAVIRDHTTAGGLGQFGAIQGAASSFGVEVSPIDVRCELLLMALSVISKRLNPCGFGRTAEVAELYDPSATLPSISYCSSETSFSPYQSTRLSRYDASPMQGRA